MSNDVMGEKSTVLDCLVFFVFNSLNLYYQRWKIIIMITNVQCNLAKYHHIADMSPLAAENVFVRSWPHRIPGSLDPRESAPSPKRHLDRFSGFCSTHRPTDHATPSVAMGCIWCGVGAWDVDAGVQRQAMRCQWVTVSLSVVVTWSLHTPCWWQMVWRVWRRDAQSANYFGRATPSK